MAGAGVWRARRTRCTDRRTQNPDDNVYVNSDWHMSHPVAVHVLKVDRRRTRAGKRTNELSP